MNRSYVDHLVMNNDKLLGCMYKIIEYCAKTNNYELAKMIEDVLSELDPLEEV